MSLKDTNIQRSGGTILPTTSDQQQLIKIQITICSQLALSKVSKTKMQRNIRNSHSDRARRFAFTLNNYTEAEVTAIKTEFSKKVRYLIIGFEVGEECGTPHIQGYFEVGDAFHAPWSYKQIHKMPGMARSSPSQARESGPINVVYCSKDGNFFEYGTPLPGQGKRSDLDAVATMIQADTTPTILEVAMAHPVAYMKFTRGITSMLGLMTPTRHFMTHGYWIFGPTGCGKSRWAHSVTPTSTYVKDASTEWFCGYQGESTMIIDDYRPNARLSFSFLLKLADRYPLPLQVKGGQVQMTSKRLIVTSPVSPEKAFEHLSFMTEGDIAQLHRRFTVIDMNETCIVPYLCPDDLAD